MSEFECIISDKRVCKPIAEKNIVFIIGPNSAEFATDIETIKDVLAGFGLTGDFALLNEAEKGLDAFCGKICTKIITSLFCVALLNEPVALCYHDAETGKEKTLRVPRPNVHYELGVAIGVRKRVIPIIKEGARLPFDIQHLDAIMYANQDDLREKLKVSVLELLTKPTSKSVVKEPDLELALLDTQGKPVCKLTVNPKFFRYKKVLKPKRHEPQTGLATMLASYEQAMASMAASAPTSIFNERKPTPDLAPIRVMLRNKGGRKAEGIRVFLDFPEECKLVDKMEFQSFLIPPAHKVTYAGLFVERENVHLATAWSDLLGNDLKQEFEEVYVSFKPEERTYVIEATVTQHDYPKKKFFFKLHVKPLFEQKIEYVDDDDEKEDSTA